MWQTIYIKGRNGFKPKVKKSLSKVLIEGMDYIKGSTVLDSKLYWIAPHITIRQFKEAIGASNVWKYRLKFHTDIDEKNNIINTNFGFTQEEIQLMDKYNGIHPSK